MAKAVFVIVGIAYLLALPMAIRTSVAFWLFREKDPIAHKAMQCGFFLGFISIWLIYPIYLIKDALSNLKH